MFLAAAIRYEPSQQELAMLLVIGGLVALLTVANLAVNLWNGIKRRPSIEEELKTYATLVHVNSMESRILHEIAAFKHERREDIRHLHERVEDVKEAVSQGFKDIQRDLGELDGRTRR